MRHRSNATIAKGDFIMRTFESMAFIATAIGAEMLVIATIFAG